MVLCSCPLWERMPRHRRAKGATGMHMGPPERGASEPLSLSPHTEVHPPVGIPVINQEIPTSTE